MWYLAEVLTAQPRKPGQQSYWCESCNVLIEAPDANEAYRKAIAWGQSYVSGPSLHQHELLGVAHLTTIGEAIGDGVDICGRYFEERDVWERREELIPPEGRLSAVAWEKNREKPLQEFFDEEAIRRLKQSPR